MKVTSEAVQKGKAKVIAEWLPKLCDSLVKADPEIIAIVQFGSSVYAPDLACDIDLLILTRKREDIGVYIKATANCPLNVDVVPVEVGKPLGFVGVAVRAFGRVIFGDENWLWEAIKDMPPPTFDEARRVLPVGRTYLRNAIGESDPIGRETHYRNAFNTLFDAARLAVMAYLATDETRWGTLVDRLPPHIERRFRAIVNEFHVAIFYHREIPLDVEAEFERGREIVLQFINDLEAERVGQL